MSSTVGANITQANVVRTPLKVYIFEGEEQQVLFRTSEPIWVKFLTTRTLTTFIIFDDFL